MLSLPIHTRITSALADASTWPSIATIIAGSAAFEGWIRAGMIICGVIGVLLKGGQPPSGSEAA